MSKQPRKSLAMGTEDLGVIEKKEASERKQSLVSVESHWNQSTGSQRDEHGLYSKQFGHLSD